MTHRHLPRILNGSAEDRTRCDSNGGARNTHRQPARAERVRSRAATLAKLRIGRAKRCETARRISVAMARESGERVTRMVTRDACVRDGDLGGARGSSQVIISVNPPRGIL